MRKTKSFKIEGHDQEITVRELTVKEIISLMEDDILGDASLETLRKSFSDVFLPLCTENVTLSDLLGLAPSELMEVWDNFQEVNASFFELARKSGLMKSIGNLKEAVLRDFSKLLVSSSSVDIPES
jgi:hypothetical protein